MSGTTFTDEVLPSGTHGRTAYLELPVALTYYPRVRRARLGYYLEAGLLSHRLHRDEMRFEFANERPGQISEMEAGGPVTALATGLRLGGGLSVALPGGLPLDIGPFVQVPLRQTCYSEVSLYTAGVRVRIPMLRGH